MADPSDPESRTLPMCAHLYIPAPSCQSQVVEVDNGKTVPLVGTTSQVGPDYAMLVNDLPIDPISNMESGAQ